MVADLIDTATTARGRATIALSGGSTPKAMYRIMAQHGVSGQVDWSQVFVFFGDERFVPPEDRSSNFGMAREALLSYVAIPPENIFAVQTDAASPSAAAEGYEKTLRSVLGEDPHLDVVLLGVGEDGHTASLFPGNESLDEMKRWVVSSPPGTLPPPIDRITLTLPAINAARSILVLISGVQKIPIVGALLEDWKGMENAPIARVKPDDGFLWYLVDRSAMPEVDDEEGA